MQHWPVRNWVLSKRRNKPLTVMRNNNNPSPVDETQAAISAALQAERETADSIAKSELQAQEIITEARARAHRIADAADSRITVLHQRCLTAIDRAIAELDAEDQHNQSDINEEKIGDDQLKKITQSLAEKLTSPASGTLSND